jgi:hypothetical protein
LSYKLNAADSQVYLDMHSDRHHDAAIHLS